MVKDISWWLIFFQIFGINCGVWFYVFITNKISKESRRFNWAEAWWLSFGFLMCAITFKWGW